jgi:DNA modification methylase
MVGALRQGGSYYVCMSAAEYAMVIYQLRKLGYAGAPIIWVKPSIGLGAQEYRPQYEVILYGYKGPRKKRTWNGKRKESNLWDMDPDRGVTARKADGGGMILEFGLGFNTVSVLFSECLDGTVINCDGATSDLWQVGREYVGGYVHPTQKPTALVKRAILNSTEKGDLVVDGFLGSGTTMVAAEESGRVCYGIEQDERFVAVNLERMERMGLEPVRVDKVH